MLSKRRLFLKSIAGGSAGLLFSGSLPGLALPGILFGNSLDSNYENGRPVFPFFGFVPRYNFGDYIPKDQGGKFVHTEIFDTEDDKLIVDKIRGGRLQQVYGTPINWSLYEKTELEKSVWLNRFYFLPSLARLYYLDRDQSCLDDMMQFISSWVKDNPRLPDSHRKTFNWRDMQVAWRSIHWSWCYYLTENGLTQEQKKIITDSLKEHADILLNGFGKAPLNEFNHQSHGGLAMLYLGVLFPSLEQAKELRENGMRILSHHLEKVFFEDGGNVEFMFGYYPFETHIFRDTYLLCSQNNIGYPASLLPMLEKMAAYIAAVAQPDGTMPQVNDSFEMPTAVILATVNELLDKRRRVGKGKTKYFPDSQLGVIRHDGKLYAWYLLAYPASVIGAHAHAGRLAFNFWLNGSPVLTDSGCPNYDNPKLVSWYRTSRAHNTVLIDGKSDEATSGKLLWVGKRNTGNRIVNWGEKDSLSYCRMISPGTEVVNNAVSWSRSLVLVKEKFLVLYDRFDASGEHDYEVLFHFSPTQVSVNEKRKALQLPGKSSLAILPSDPSMISSLTVEDAELSINGKDRPAPMATLKFTGKGLVHSVVVFMPGVEDLSSVKVSQEITEDGVGLEIISGNSERTVLLMRNPDSPKLSVLNFRSHELFEVF